MFVATFAVNALLLFEGFEIDPGSADSTVVFYHDLCDDGVPNAGRFPDFSSAHVQRSMAGPHTTRWCLAGSCNNTISPETRLVMNQESFTPTSTSMHEL